MNCDICDGKLVIGTGGMAKCEECGMEYTAERVKEKAKELSKNKKDKENKKTSTATQSDKKDDGANEKIENLTRMMDNAIQGNNPVEVERYANQIIEIDGNNVDAWVKKGMAIASTLTSKTFRFKEGIYCYTMAWRCMDELKRQQVTGPMETFIIDLLKRTVKLWFNEINYYVDNQMEQNLEKIFTMVIEDIQNFENETEIPVWSNEKRTLFAGYINTELVALYQDVNKHYYRFESRSKIDWENYYTTLDNCLKLFEFAYEYSYDHEICRVIYDNYIVVAIEAKNSCSTTYSSYSNRYVTEYSFTDKAIKLRSKAIEEAQKIRDKHEKANIDKTRNILLEEIKKERENVDREKYWEQHKDEKQKLEQEIVILNSKKDELKKKLEDSPENKEVGNITKKITDIKEQIASLGIFSGKEKKLLASKIDELLPLKEDADLKFEKVEKETQVEIKKLDEEIKKINNEFKAIRENVQPVSKIQLYKNGKGIITAKEWLEYNNNILKGRLSLGEGEDAIEDLTSDSVKAAKERAKELVNLFEEAAETFDSVEVNFDDEEMKKELEETKKENVERKQELKSKLEELYNLYRTWFLKYGNPYDLAMLFLANGLDKNIGTSISYGVAGEQTNEKIIDFILLITNILKGLDINIDIKEFETDMIEIALGNKQELTVEGETVIGKITGGIHRNLLLELQPRSI